MKKTAKRPKTKDQRLKQERLKTRTTVYLLFTTPDLLFLRAVIRYSQHGRTLTFAVRVTPRASRSEVGGEHDGALRVRIAASPVDGAANRELTRVLATAFKLRRSAVEIVGGAKSKNKTVRIAGADAATLERLIQSQ